MRNHTVHANTAAGLETLVGIRGPDFVLVGADTAVGPGVVWTATRVDKVATIGSSSKTLVALAGDAADADFLVNLLKARATLYEYQSGLGSVEYVRIQQLDKEEEGITAPSTITRSTAKEGNEYSVSDIAQLARSQIAQQLRSRSQCRVCLLVAGLKPNEKQAEGAVSTQRLQSQIRQASQLVGKKVSTTPSVSDNALTLDNMCKVDLPKLYWLDELGTMISVPYGSHGIGSMFMNSILDEGYRPDLTRQEAYALLQKCFRQLRQRYAVQTPHLPIVKCIDRDGVHVMSTEDLL
jgi:20S proteasome subunit beta 4